MINYQVFSLTNFAFLLTAVYVNALSKSQNQNDFSTFSQP